MTSLQSIPTVPTQVDMANAAQISAVAAGVVMAVAGWSGLIWLITNQLPTVPNRWAFYALMHIALTGTALPFVRLLHQRFSRNHGIHVKAGVLVRQAVWFGLLGTTSAWLRVPRLLSLPIVVILIVALVVIESLLRLRERTQWHPE
jgi:hypothetical protein